MYLCKITKREVYKNNNGKDAVIHEIVCKNGSGLAKAAKAWLTKNFLPAYKDSIMTAFISIDGFKSLNEIISDSANEPHNFYNGRATLFNEYGQPLYIIAIDVYSVDEIK